MKAKLFVPKIFTWIQYFVIMKVDTVYFYGIYFKATKKILKTQNINLL